MKFSKATLAGVARGAAASGRCHVDYALYAPARSTLVLMGWVAPPADGDVQVQVETGDGAVAEATWTARYPRPDVCSMLGATPAAGYAGGVAAAVTLAAIPAAGGLVRVRFCCGGWAESAEARVVCTLPEAMRPAFAADWRRLVSALDLQRGSPLPAAVAEMAGQPPDQTRTEVRFHVDQAYQIPDCGHFVQGWCHDPGGALRQLLIVDEDSGEEAELTSLWERTGRPDVAKHLCGEAGPGTGLGFLALVPARIADATHTPRRLTFLAVLRDGTVVSHRHESLPADNAIAFCKTALGWVRSTHPRLREILDRHVGPAIESLWQPPASSDVAVDVREFGQPPAKARVSVIVPLYGRYDFMQFQLALFADDPTLRDADLIYVIDDPEILEPALSRASSLQALFRVPFRTVHAGRNLGYAGANNLGAAQARGEFVVLLNSDVMPSHPGWLPPLMAALENLPRAGIVGARLLYEDGSIQHAGMRGERYALLGGLWINAHPGKGLPDLSAAREPREVEAVTGACMAMRTSLYRELGGLDEGYVVGDFEDSDICHRVRRHGQKIYYLPEVTLYHLERQSLALVGDSDWRQKLTLYNCWRHSRLHGLE